MAWNSVTDSESKELTDLTLIEAWMSKKVRTT